MNASTRPPTKSETPTQIDEHRMGARTLSGYTVGITADRRSEEQIQLLEDRGATCVHGPMLETQALLPDSGIATATRNLIENPPDVTILSTGIGVRGWFSSADSLFLGNALRSAISTSQIYVRGPKAHGAAITVGLTVDSGESWLSFDEIVDELAKTEIRGKRIAVQLDGDPDGLSLSRLHELDAEVVAVPVYQWALPANTSPAMDLIQSVADQRIDAVTFTSRPAVQNFAGIAQDMGLFSKVCDATNSTTTMLCVGKRTAESVAEHGLGRARFPDRPLLGTMIMMLTEHLEQRTTELALGGQTVVLRGRELSVNAEPAQALPFRERKLFEVLARRPGVVFSKDRLLDVVWRGTAHDEHAVEVAVGRLRKRLGDAGSGIETVRRRGYRIAAP